MFDSCSAGGVTGGNKGGKDQGLRGCIKFHDYEKKKKKMSSVSNGS